MSDERGQPTTWDLIQAVRSDVQSGFNDLREEMRTGNAQLRNELRGMVRIETFEARNQATDQRVANVEQAVSETRDTHNRDIAEVKQRQELAEQARREDRRNVFKIVGSGAFAIVAALLGVLLPIMLSG